MQEPCQYLTPSQQIEYYNRKSIWRLLYRLKLKSNGMSRWDMYIWLGGGVSHQNRDSNLVMPASASTGRMAWLLLFTVGSVGCTTPNDVWLPCDVLEPPSYCSGSSPSSVHMLPVERYAVLINLSTSTPP